MQRARRGELAAEEAGAEPGDFVAPGSVPDASPLPAGFAGGAASLEQLRGLHEAGVIDADTFALIEASMTNATAQSDRFHAAGVTSDEIDLLQRGEPAPATILALREPSDADARRQLTLEVHPAAGPPYTVECAIGVAHPAAAELKAGNFLPVKIDPDDPQRVAIDWTTFGVGS